MSDDKKGLILWGVWIAGGVLGLILFQNLLGLVTGVIVGVIIGIFLPFGRRAVNKKDTLPKDYKRDIARKIIADPRRKKVINEYLHKAMPHKASNSRLVNVELQSLISHKLEEIFIAAKDDKSLKKGEWKLARGFARGTAMRLKDAVGRQDKEEVSALLAISQFALVSEFSVPTVESAAMLIEYELDNV